MHVPSAHGAREMSLTHPSNQTARVKGMMARVECVPSVRSTDLFQTYGTLRGLIFFHTFFLKHMRHRCLGVLFRRVSLFHKRSHTDHEFFLRADAVQRIPSTPDVRTARGRSNHRWGDALPTMSAITHAATNHMATHADHIQVMGNLEARSKAR